MTVDSSFLENAGAVNHARDFRRIFAGLFLSQGVLGSADLDVSQRAAGANMSVDVAVGKALISDAQTVIGLYPFINDAIVNLAIAANAAGSTRIDLIVARVKDTEYGDASNVKTVEVVQGTAGAGVPATPTRCLALASVSIASGAASILTANITELRVWAGPGLGARGQLAQGSTTSTGSIVGTTTDVTGSTTGALTTTAGRRYRYQFSVPVSSTVAADPIILTVYKDGAAYGQAVGFTVPAANVTYPVSFFVEDSPTAASHTYKLTAVRFGGSGTVSVGIGSWSFDDIGEQTLV